MFFLIVTCLCLTLTTATHTKKTRVIGGSDANIENFPYLASLIRLSTDEYVCAGTIISSQHIITAAHCFNDSYLCKNDFKVFVGRTKLMSQDGGEFLPEKLYIHPLFKGYIDNNMKFIDDIAIVKLQQAIPFNQFQNKVNLPSKDIPNGVTAKISGWGATSYSLRMANNHLQELTMLVTNYKNCKPIYPYKLYNDQFCGFNSYGVGPFLGDSGGPVVVDGTIIGIISISYTKPLTLPHICTNVYSHLNFITKILEK